MRRVFYPKLALDGIRKNRRLYIPYIITGAVMTMMYYILSYLCASPVLAQMTGGDVLRSMLPLGCGVIGFFSLIFIFYTNTFLIRQRNREFGLYNVLGMDKRNIGRIMFWENSITFVLSVGLGLVLGALLSKLAELCMMNIMGNAVDFVIRIGWKSITDTVTIFGAIYFLLLINSLIRVSRSKPLELLRSDKTGERPPKANWALALLGLVILAAAYYLALSIESPIEAIVWFFIAVIMVIAATYIIFIAGSVTLCRILQKNKSYYYRPNHFVSVSSMVYRMKRNGAGLASICILCTMVLVMLSSTSSLYIGAEDSIARRYPTDMSVTVRIPDAERLNEATFSGLRRAIGEKTSDIEEPQEFYYAEIAGLFTDDGITVDPSVTEAADFAGYSSIGNLIVLPLDVYDRNSDKPLELKSGECVILSRDIKYTGDTFSIDGTKKLRVAMTEEITEEDIVLSAYYASMLVPSVFLITPDFDAVTEPLRHMVNSMGYDVMYLRWTYAFDMKADREVQLAAYEALGGEMPNVAPKDEDGNYNYRLECREWERDDFYGMYGSLFFLGIMLSIVFLFAAVMIIYYKQISEGFEDQSRFDIMQKVGMTKRDIRKSINSQIVTVFFAPLLFAGMHLAFAFPIVWKMLQLFGLKNLWLMIAVTAGSLLIFGIFYALVYKLTAGAYYNIVSGPKEE